MTLADSGVEVRWHEDPREFRALARAARSLHLEQVRPDLFSDPMWHILWWEQYGRPEWKPRILTCQVAGEIRGWLALYEERAKVKGLPVNRLRLMADQDIGSSRLDALVSPTDGDLIHKAMERALADLAGIHMLRFGPVAKDSLLAKISSKVGTCRVSPDQEVGVLEFPETTSEFWDGMSKNKRKELRRRRRRLESTFEVTVTEHRGDDPEAREILHGLNVARFETLGIDGGFKDHRLAFFHDALGRESDPQRSVIHVLRADGRPLAALAVFVEKESWFAYQGGMDPEFRDFSPANVLDIILFEKAIERGVRIYDFGPGAQEYKIRFGAQVRQTLRIDVARTPLWSLALKLAPVGRGPGSSRTGEALRKG